MTRAEAKATLRTLGYDEAQLARAVAPPPSPSPPSASSAQPTATAPATTPIHPRQPPRTGANIVPFPTQLMEVAGTGNELEVLECGSRLVWLV